MVWSLAASGLLAGHLVILWVYPVRKEHSLFGDEGHQDRCPVSELPSWGSSLQVPALRMSQRLLLEI